MYPNSHAWYSYPLDTPDDWYGFEAPAVDDYFAATSVDVRRDPFDANDYYRHYGSYWTLALWELSGLARERQRRLVVGMDMGPWQVYLPWAAPRPCCTWRWRNEWEKWTSWGSVDLCIGHQVNMWDYEGWPANQLPYIPGTPGRAPYEFVREMFGPSDHRQFQLWAFLTMHKDRAQSELAKALAGSKSSCDGLMIREAMDFEFDVGWDLLSRALGVRGAAGSLFRSRGGQPSGQSREAATTRSSLTLD